LIFEIRDAEEGGFFARALGHAIFTEGETWEELRGNLLEAVGLHFEDSLEASEAGADALRQG
jgi:predicted RNase H-like HicB family nuclease